MQLLSRQLNAPQVFSFVRHCVRRTMASESSVLVEERGKAGIITLNRPKALNALNTEMVRYVNDFDPNRSMVYFNKPNIGLYRTQTVTYTHLCCNSKKINRWS